MSYFSFCWTPHQICWIVILHTQKSNMDIRVDINCWDIGATMQHGHTRYLFRGDFELSTLVLQYLNLEVISGQLDALELILYALSIISKASQSQNCFCVEMDEQERKKLVARLGLKTTFGIMIRTHSVSLWVFSLPTGQVALLNTTVFELEEYDILIGLDYGFRIPRKCYFRLSKSSKSVLIAENNNVTSLKQIVFAWHLNMAPFEKFWLSASNKNIIRGLNSKLWEVQLANV